MYYLDISATERAIRVKSDIIINRAMDLIYVGANDQVIRILANILQEKLSHSRARLVRQNLILAYCQRNSIEDSQQAQILLDEEYPLARQVLSMDAQSYHDLLYILQCNLYVIKAKMEHPESQETLNTYKQEAEDIYAEWIEMSPSGRIDERDVTPDQLEIHRSMADIYILAKDQDLAWIEHDFVQRYKPVGIRSGG